MGCNTSQEQNANPDNITENGEVKNEGAVTTTADDTNITENLMNGEKENLTKENGKLSRNNSKNDEITSKEVITKTLQSAGGVDVGGGGKNDIDNKNNELNGKENNQVNGEADIAESMGLEGSAAESES